MKLKFSSKLNSLKHGKQIIVIPGNNVKAQTSKTTYAKHMGSCINHLPWSFILSLLKFIILRFKGVTNHQSDRWVNLAPPLWKMVWGTISQMQFTTMLLKIPLIKVWNLWTIDHLTTQTESFNLISHIKYLSLHYQEIPSIPSTNLCKIIKMNSLYNAV